ncbi:MAG: ABC transporter permease subunit, partial [Ruminococcus sp.]|nr:ABC transporter permease subunit [Ruminococcus sp.]
MTENVILPVQAEKSAVKSVILKSLVITFFAAATIFLSFVPGQITVPENSVYVLAMVLIWAYFIARTISQKGENHPDIAILVYGAFILWEVLFRIKNIGNPTLEPPLENVFQVFWNDRGLILEGIGHSLMILAAGFTIALVLGNVLGLIVGWHQRLSDDFTPVAKVLSPIPPMVYTPYLIALMPDFTSASIAVIGFGMFWPTFLGMINRVKSMNGRIIDSAKAMDVSTLTMLFRIILPYNIPSIIASVKIQLSTIFMILIMAEMIGATSGMGFFIKKYSDYADYTRVLAGIFVVGIVITLLN